MVREMDITFELCIVFGGERLSGSQLADPSHQQIINRLSNHIKYLSFSQLVN